MLEKPVSKHGVNINSVRFTIFFLFFFSKIYAQDTIKVPFVIINTDTVPVFELDQVLYDNVIALTDKERNRISRLEFNVRKVYPLSKEAVKRLGIVNTELTKLATERERKRFLKGYESMLLSEYKEDLKKLSVNQGKILMKLVNRETNKTSYDLVKEYRGAFAAIFWQGLATVFGATLKIEFDPVEDYEIEAIVRMIEQGR